MPLSSLIVCSLQLEVQKWEMWLLTRVRAFVEPCKVFAFRPHLPIEVSLTPPLLRTAWPSACSPTTPVSRISGFLWPRQRSSQLEHWLFACFRVPFPPSQSTDKKKITKMSGTELKRTATGSGWIYNYKLGFDGSSICYWLPIRAIHWYNIP